MALREGNRTQHSLLPSSIEDYVGESDPVRAYDAFIEALDMSELGLVVDRDRVGNLRYDPKAMLKLLIYGYSYGIRSSRKLERATHHNLSFIWLVGGLQPGYRSIARFRRQNRRVLQGVLKSCARLCLKLGLIEGNVLFVDGSKVRGNCGKSAHISRKGCAQQLAQLDDRIKRVLEECEQVDESESERGSLVHLPEELVQAQALKEKVQASLEELEREDKTSKNRTDVEAILFKGRQGSHVGYNVQAVVDAERGLVVSTDAVSETNDRKQLKCQVDEAESTLGHRAETVCADAGYENVEVQKPLMDADKTVIVPSQQQAGGKEPVAFDARRFAYDEGQDQYVCPMGKVLKHSTYEKSENRHVYRISAKSDCLKCRHYGRCTKDKKGRSIKRHRYQAQKEQLEATYQLPASQEIYRQRKMRAELPFGHIKHNLQAGQLLLRGREGARAECSLLFTAFNMSRMLNLLGGVAGFRRALSEVTG